MFYKKEKSIFSRLDYNFKRKEESKNLCSRRCQPFSGENNLIVAKYILFWKNPFFS